VLVEVEVKRLVGIVYTELLKTVSTEILKAKDVQNTNRTRLLTTNTQNVILAKITSELTITLATVAQSLEHWTCNQQI